MAWSFTNHVTPDNLEEAKAWYNQVSANPSILTSKGFPLFAVQKLLTTIKSEINSLETGDYSGLQAAYAQTGTAMDPSFEKYVDNSLSNQRTLEAREHEQNMRDTSLLSSGQQLNQLGLSSSGVLQTGGLSSNGVGAAETSKTNLSQQAKIERFEQNMGIARSMISLAGSLASSGIYGASLGAARHAANALGEATAHSAMSAISRGWSGKGNGSLLSGQLGEEWSKLPGAY